MTLSQDKSRSQQTSEQSVWGAQAPYLQSLYGQATDLWSKQAGQVGPAAQSMAGGIMGGLGGYGSPMSNPAFQNLQQRAQGGSPFLNQQIQGLGSDIGQFFQQQIMPGIASQAGQAGQFGGSRQGIASGMAGQDALRQFSQGATNLRQADYGQGLQAAGMLGGLSNDYLGQMGNIYNLGMSPFSAQWMPLQNMANIIGNPTVLGSSQGSSKSYGWQGGGGVT